MITDTEFIAAADAHARDASARRSTRRSQTSDADVDWSLNDGILEIECGDGSKLIVNRHVAEPRDLGRGAQSGGFHFRAAATAAGATRAPATSSAPTLARLLRRRRDSTVALPALAAPAI